MVVPVNSKYGATPGTMCTMSQYGATKIAAESLIAQINYAETRKSKISIRKLNFKENEQPRKW
jgi:hypothetical protein